MFGRVDFGCLNTINWEFGISLFRLLYLIVYLDKKE